MTGGDVWKFLATAARNPGGVKTAHPHVLRAPAPRLYDDGGVDLVGGFHNGAHLFEEFVDVERGQAVAVFGGMIKRLAPGYSAICVSYGQSLNKADYNVFAAKNHKRLIDFLCYR